MIYIVLLICFIYSTLILLYTKAWNKISVSKEANNNNTWINSYLLVAPGTLGNHGHIGFVEIGMGLGYLGLFIYVVLNALTKVPLEVKNHPFSEESKNLHT